MRQALPDGALATRPVDLGRALSDRGHRALEGKADEARRELESIVKESPQFTEAHVSLSIALLPAEANCRGDREKRGIVES